MASGQVSRRVAGIILLFGAALLIAAVFVPWYTYQVKTTTAFGSGTTNLNYYPGLSTENGTLQCSSSSSSCPYTQSSYQSARENNTGVVAETGFALLIVGFVLGLVAAILAIVSRGNLRRTGPAYTLGMIAMLIALIAPLLFAASLPGAVSKDTSVSERPSSSGPWSTFFGTNTSSILTPAGRITIDLTWGPALGWYLSFAAFVVLLIGVLLLFRYRKEPEPSPVSVPGAATPVPAAPPAD